MSNIFGSTTQNATQGTTGGLFGSTTNTNANQTTGGGLFGSTTNNNTNQNNGGGLFGGNPTQNTGGNSLFGAGNAQNTGTGGGLFGANIAQSNTGGGLFGNQSATNSATNTASIFGSAPTQNTTPLFGNTGNAPQAPTNSLFGNTTQPGSNPFAASQSTQIQPQQQQQQQFLVSSYGPSFTVGQGGHQISQVQLQRLQGSGFSTTPNEKTILDQVRTVSSKWDPDDNNNILKAYFYNAVNKAYAPFYYPDPKQGEDEKSWEEALSQKPEFPKFSPGEDPNMSYVPALCRGFRQLGDRVEVQIRSVNDIRSRLHEMNNALTSVMNRHQQNVTVRLANTKKQHQDLAQRSLRLAVKIQVLRNRGYALDGAEEGLRKTLNNLESQVMDSGFAGREDEIWARMVALRERARWLEEEGSRVAAQLDGQPDSRAAGEGISEDILAKTRKILKDYDDQLGHLNRELEDVKKEYGEWEATQHR